MGGSQNAKQHDTNSTKRVCVVGAGIAGLVTTKVLRADGFDVFTFDKEAAIGGVWAPSRAYPEVQTNTPRELYEFTDFPYPKTAADFPTAAQVRSYLDAYVEYFNLRDSIRLATEVISIARTPQDTQQFQPRFRVTVKSTAGSQKPETLYFDFVVICNGVFSKPHVPEIEGREHYTGRVLHSSQFTDEVVIFATGWLQNVDFLAPDLRKQVQEGGHFCLNRHILPPTEPHLGFVGYAQSFLSALTSEIPAHWLSQCFRGDLSLPNRAEMEQEIAHVQQWAETVFGANRQGYFIGPYAAHYVDELMEDMGLSTVRTSNLFVEYFGRFLPRRYCKVGEERRRARSEGATSSDEVYHERE